MRLGPEKLSRRWGAMSLNWSLHNPTGISFSDGGWVGGHASDVLEVDADTVLAAADTGGVWLLDRRSGHAFPASLDWECARTTSLARGPRGPNHIFCAGFDSEDNGVLYETDVLASRPLEDRWRPIDLTTPGIALIQKVVVWRSTVVVASQDGLYWAAVPRDPGARYVWHVARGSSFRAYDVDVDGFGNLIASAYDGQLWYGTVSDEGVSLIGQAIVEGLSPDQRLFACLRFAAAAASPPRVGSTIAYAACSGLGGVTGILKSEAVPGAETVGERWVLQPSRDSTTGALPVDHSTSGYMGAIAVDPNDSNTLVVGWVFGWVSRDGGATLTAFGNTHEDKHSYRYETATNRLYEASDGGVASLDLSGSDPYHGSFETGYNRGFASLQFYGASQFAPGMHLYGSSLDAGGEEPEVIAGGLQDNGNVVCARWRGTLTPWQHVDDAGFFDGGSVLVFPRTGGRPQTHIVSRLGVCRISTIVPPGDPTASREILPGDIRAYLEHDDHPDYHYTIAHLAMDRIAKVVHPQWRDDHGKLLVAVGSSGRDVFGLFADTAFSSLYWSYLDSIDGTSGMSITSLAASQTSVFVGCGNGPRIVRIENVDGIYQVSNEDGAGAGEAGRGRIDFILIGDDGGAEHEKFGILNDPRTPSHELFQRDSDSVWNPIESPARDEPICGAATGLADGTLVLFLATKNSVWASNPTFDSWSEERTGLPADPWITSLAFNRHTEGPGMLYAGTYGWSTWATSV